LGWIIPKPFLAIKPMIWVKLAVNVNLAVSDKQALSLLALWIQRAIANKAKQQYYLYYF
jgi:hypothetical protein